MEIDFRTDRQKALAERRSKIVELYRKLTSENPDVSRYRVIEKVAEAFSLTRAGVEGILIKEGAYVRKTK